MRSFKKLFLVTITAVLAILLKNGWVLILVIFHNIMPGAAKVSAREQFPLFRPNRV